MRRDKDCPYKNHCNNAPEGCEECDWHEAFEKFRRRIIRMENRLSRANALLDSYRGVEGSRLQEIMDAEIHSRCLTLHECELDDIQDFMELYAEFMAQLRIDPPVYSIMRIGAAIEAFLKGVEQEARKRKKEEEVEFDG